MSTTYKIPSVPAGSSPLISELHSQFKLNKDVQDTLAAKLSFILPQKQNNSVLIIGGKCGLTAELLIPFCNKIDIVQEEPYLSLLKQRFINKKDVQYTFTTQGQIGSEQIRPKPNTQHCKVNIFEMQRFDKQKQGQNCYNVIVLQNILINQKMNILEELLRIQHQVLITMIVPGKLVHQNLFQLLAGIQQNILKVFYEHEYHQRLQNTKYITGRRKQQLFWEIFIWKKKPASQQGSLKLIHQIKNILKKQFETHNVQKKKIETGMKSYQTKELVDMYLEFHYNDQEYFTVKNFPKVCGDRSVEIAKKENLKGRALDIGCAVGRTSIVLAEYFEQVIGIDLSHSFIEAANQVLNQNYTNLKTKVKFLVGDACKLQKSLGKFSLIFGGNLIDRLYDPQAFLIQVAQFLQTQGVLILTSPYSWLQDFTPKQKWIGGYYNKQGKAISTPQGLNNILTQHGFKQLIQPQDIRFVIRQNHWVFQYTLANVTFWKKISQ